MSELGNNSEASEYRGAAGVSDVERREENPTARHGAPWDRGEYEQLIKEIHSGLAVGDIASIHQRAQGGITSACRRLLPVKQRRVSSNAAATELARYLDEGPGDVLANLSLGTTPRQRRQSEPVTPPPELTAADAISELAMHPDCGEQITVLEAGDAAALSSEAVSLLDEKPREQKILQMRIGIGDDPQTLAEIGQHFGLTRERIRQIQNRALTVLVRRARRPGSPGHLLARLLDIPSTDEFDESFAEHIGDIAAAEFNAPSGLSILFLLCAAGVPQRRARDVASLASKSAKWRRADAKERERESVVQGRADRIVCRWIEHAEWPAPSPASDWSEAFSALRLTAPGEAAGSFYSDKLGREVLYESGLERDALMALEKSSDVEWFQEQPLSIPYVWQGRERRYYPDILAALLDGRGLLIEVKPLMNMPVALNLAKAEAGRGYASIRGWGWVSVDRSRTHRDLETFEISIRSLRAIETALAIHEHLNWRQVLQLRSRSQVKLREIAAYVIQTGAELQVEPRYCIYPTE